MGIFSRRPKEADLRTVDSYVRPGFAAIEAAVQAVHPGVVPLRIEVSAAPAKPFVGAIHAYDAGDHWHLLTYGLSDLAGTGSAAPGFELTLRVDRAEIRPPAIGWPIQLLSTLANYVVVSRLGFTAYSRLESRTSLNGDSASTARSLLFVPDAVLPSVSTPGGDLPLLQAVPVTAAELQRSKEFTVAQVAGELAAGNPLLVARLYR